MIVYFLAITLLVALAINPYDQYGNIQLYSRNLISTLLLSR
jgi:hypothetical protein